MRNERGTRLKVRLSEIPDAGLILSEKLDPVEMRLDTPELTFIDRMEVTATFEKNRDTVLVRVTAVGRQQMVCGRCLVLYDQPYDGEFDLGYSVKDQLDLDVTDDVRQEILLSYPVRFLCREECRGLCPRCGANLNQGPCGCLAIP